MNRLQSKLLTRTKRYLFRSYTPRWVVLLIDFIFAVTAASVAWGILYALRIGGVTLSLFIFSYVAIILFRVVSFLIGKTYYGIVRYTGSEDITRITTVLTTGEVVLLAIATIIYFAAPQFYIPFYILLIEYIFLLSFMVISRILFKVIFYKGVDTNKKKVVIYGCGESALAVKFLMENTHDVSHKIEGFIDDQVSSIGKTLEGVPIYSSNNLEELLVNRRIDKLVFAKKGLSSNRKREVIEICLDNDISILEAPDFDEWMDGDINISQIRKIRIEDLLNRGEIYVDESNLKKQILGKTVLVTGAAGSIGSEIVRQLLPFNPAHIILFDQAETPLYSIDLELTDKGSKIHSIEIGDIRDSGRIEHIFKKYSPDIVYHAAAYKHVPMMEAHPIEGIKTNVMGTINVADCAAKYKTDCFVMVSTDKAVNPTNVMGASKRIAEIYVQSLNLKTKTKFITTRFGNVLGSNGSVVHKFRQQIDEGGPITVTHPEITRFFMTITEACRLVLQAGSLGNGGEIYIFDMGDSIKIVDLAKKMIKLSGLQLGKDIEIIYSGLRPGEKLYEEVLNDKETTIPTEHKKIKAANVRRYDYAKVKDALSKLSQSLSNNDNFEIVRQMKILVPEFKSENSIYQDVDTEIENGTSERRIS